MFVKIFSVTLIILLFSAAPAAVHSQEDKPEDLVRSVLMSAPGSRGAPLAKLVERGKQDIIASLIMLLRFRGNDPEIIAAISELAGEQLGDWFEAMVWQQEHPEITSHSSYRPLKIFLYSQIDMTFLRFIGDDRARAENLNIRLEEITWGGVKVDGIPALNYPPTLPADKADYLLDDDLVYGVYINGEARAYPLRILGWHEMVNDKISGVPVALAYCTLCGTGILYETLVEGRKEPFVFGSSGLLYRSNKLMFDRQTDSLWNQYTGRPISGRLQKSGFQLKALPMIITSWKEWKNMHPATSALSPKTGFDRDYSSGNPYKKYFASPDLMFPVQVSDRSGLKPKDLVFGITQPGAAKAWPMAVFEKKKVINDTLGKQPLVLIGYPATRTVRAYARGEQEFSQPSDAEKLQSAGEIWQISEDFLTSSSGEKLPRLPGRVSYWFAWNSFMGVESELYSAP